MAEADPRSTEVDGAIPKTERDIAATPTVATHSKPSAVESSDIGVATVMAQAKDEDKDAAIQMEQDEVAPTEKSPLRITAELDGKEAASQLVKICDDNTGETTDDGEKGSSAGAAAVAAAAAVNNTSGNPENDDENVESACNSASLDQSDLPASEVRSQDDEMATPITPDAGTEERRNEIAVSDTEELDDDPASGAGKDSKEGLDNSSSAKVISELGVEEAKEPSIEDWVPGSGVLPPLFVADYKIVKSEFAEVSLILPLWSLLTPCFFGVVLLERCTRCFGASNTLLNNTK
jgi:hypothetical protein